MGRDLVDRISWDVALPLKRSTSRSKGELVPDQVQTHALEAVQTGISAHLPGKQWQVVDGVAYSSLSAATNPQLGDIRVSYRVVPGGEEISILARASGNGVLAPWHSRNGRAVQLVERGDVSAAT
mmetsp:Transcript_9038/g.33244  ORF Transcript_9038/g.33244 Transcript_9038/m.33244 type:complete len:125 (-) Transcript_9038:509-883(-)